MKAEDLDDRAREVLRSVVHEFIEGGEPVGSAQLTRKGEFEVSPATMRGVLAELEELGYLEKPHTSAGRVPTDKGYRFFVDSLFRVQLREPPTRERGLIEVGLAQPATVEDRLQEVGRILHRLSHHAGVVLVPRPSADVLDRVEFIRLRGDRVVAVLIGQSGHVQNKLLTLDFAVSPEELTRAANYLTELFQRGHPIEDARGLILQAMETERASYDALAQKALRLGAAATDVSSSERVVLEGTGTFLEQREFAEDLQRMRALFRAFDEKQKLLQLLDRVQRAREMQIFIGAESDFSSQGDVTVVASPFGPVESTLGAVGVIGPTRMDYQRVIPLVSFTAQVLTRVLDEGS